MMSAAKATGWAWKLPPRDRRIPVGEDDRIVGHRARLDGQSARGIGQQVERRAHHLRLAAEAVRVLDPAAAAVAGEDFAAVEKSGDGGGDADLAGLAAQRGEARVERFDAAFQRIDRQRAGGERGGEHALAGEQGVEGDGGRRLGPVDQRQAFLGAELERLQAELLQRGGGRHDGAGKVDAAVAHQRGDQMGERREVARRADAALARNQRHGVAGQQAVERVDDRRADAGIAAAEAEQFEDDHQPRDVARQRLAEAGAVRQDQISLQLGEAGIGDAGVGQAAEAGVDAVDRVARRDDALDRRGGGGDAGQRGVVERARERPPTGRGA